MKTLLMLTLIVAQFITTPSPDAIVAPAILPRLLIDLVSDDWEVVQRAELQIEGLQGKALEALIERLPKVDSRIPLTKHRQFVFLPGDKFGFDHNIKIDYELEWTSVRIGWAIEQLTFQQFGFHNDAYQHDKTLVDEAWDLRTDESNKQKEIIDNVVICRRIRSVACHRAIAWYQREGRTWTRLKALEDALSSSNDIRQLCALNYLRSDKTPCRGLTVDYYRQHLRSLVKNLSESKNKKVRTEAALLMEERLTFPASINVGGWTSVTPKR